MKKLSLLCIALFWVIKTYSQSFSASIGTDVPYQHYLGVNMEFKNIDISYRTGILVPPYSDAILRILERFGTDKIYIDLLDAAYDFGWMNSVGAYYKFGSKKNWYAGPEFRIDWLSASDTPDDLIEAVSGQTIINPSFSNRAIELKLGLRLHVLGLRVGKSFRISSNNKHYFKTEFSISKHIASQTQLQGNGNNLERINQEINRLLWDDVFKIYGYIGGLGLAYVYKF
jgi:hypothetical protein